MGALTNPCFSFLWNNIQIFAFVYEVSNVVPKMLPHTLVEVKEAVWVGLQQIPRPQPSLPTSASALTLGVPYISQQPQIRKCDCL